MERDVVGQIESLKRQFGDPIPRSWSVNFEEEPYPDHPEWIVADSLLAIAATHSVDDKHAPFVNLVTPGSLGDPERYLAPALRAALGEGLRLEDNGQCGCGGYVLRAWRLK